MKTRHTSNEETRVKFTEILNGYKDVKWQDEQFSEVLVQRVCPASFVHNQQIGIWGGLLHSPDPGPQRRTDLPSQDGALESHQGHQ